MITQVSGPVTTQTFDPVGNTIGINVGGALTTQIWSPENRLVSIAKPAGSVETNEYRDDGMRVTTGTGLTKTNFTWEEANVLLETDIAGNLQAHNTDFPGLRTLALFQRAAHDDVQTAI